MTQNLSIIYLPVDTLVPYARNPRTHSPRQVRQVAKSIRAFGFIVPVLIDDKLTIVAGHCRVLAAKQLDLTAIPCIQIRHLNEEERRAYLLADNQLALNANWDPHLLRIELEDLSRIDLDFDVELTGFTTPEIDIILGQPQENTDPPIPHPPIPNATVTRMHDLWSLGRHRLMCADCRDASAIKKLMVKGLARLVITDPPYNVQINGHARGLGKDHHENFAMACGELSPEAFMAFLTTGLKCLCAVSLDGALHYVFMDWRSIGELLAAARMIYTEHLNLCVWNKTNAGMGSLYRSQHELVGVFKHGKKSHINNVELGKYGRYRSNVWTYAGVNSFGPPRDEELAMHPTVKPVKLITDAILDVSKRGEIVLDGFTGSGSTLLAAEQTGRRFRGVEIEPRYVDVALRRWMAVSGEMPILVETGQTFLEVERERIEQSVSQLSPKGDHHVN